ncbi:MAG TPA: aminotransferase class I/II-fold pyridoxal phosphate-dependent enzyme [Kiritimatiellia bacterium]|nr:aminotransferase class I/II-fold pyridoxal phosphate-dependent enzyme [Kiritimatiellia bacterium]
MPEVARRLSVFTESVIREMTRIARRHDAINLAQGFPDFDPPAELTDALAREARGSNHQYAITWGAPRFREALARKITRWSGVPIDPDRNLVVTCGSTEAMMVAMMTACNPGDRVVVFSPFYENYAADAILSGAEPVFVPLRPPSFAFNRAELEAAFATNPKAIVVCNPSNPCGKVFTREELLFIGALCERHDAFMIMDDVYEHIVYPPHRHVYAAALPGLADRVITCNSLSKTYSITGWRLGYVQAAPRVIEAARKVHDFLTVGAAAPLQEAAVTALNFPDSYYEELSASYAAKREWFLGLLRDAGLRFSEPQGAYYVLVDLSEWGFPDDRTAAEWFAAHGGVAGVPGSSFFREPVAPMIRFHFAKKEETLRAAGARLRDARARWDAYRAASR